MLRTLINLTILFFFVVLSNVLFSQVATTIVNRNSSKRLYAIKDKFNSHYRIRKKLNVDSLLIEDAKEEKDGLPYRFGIAHKADLGLKDGQWKKVDGGKLWQLLISSSNAYSINLQFDDFHLSEGTELNIYSANGEMKIGPFTSILNNPTHFLGTDLVKGDSIILEFFQPDSVKKPSRLHISNIIHAYKQTFQEYSSPTGGSGQSAACNVDVACPTGNGWYNQINSVGMVIVDGYRICSGSLVNNSCQDLKAYFLTAFHCVNNSHDSNTNNWIFRFRYQRTTCGGKDSLGYFTYNGSTLRASWQPSDFALLELNQKPASTTGITYAGWTRSSSPATSSVSIHHPQGDFMKISTNSNPAISNPTNFIYGINDLVSANSHWLVSFQVGGSQGGSSGSPLFDQNHRIVGQLHGGTGDCPTDPGFNAYFGRFDRSWVGGVTNSSRLSDWLDPTGIIPANGSLDGLTIPVISGNDYICPVGSPGASYSVTNRPAGSSAVTWSSSPSGATSINPTTGVFTRYGYGLGFVTGQYTARPGCAAVSATKSIWMGFPPVSTILGPSSICPNSGGLFYAGAPSNSGYAAFSSSYGWSFDPYFTLASGSTSSSNPIALLTPSNFMGGNVRVYAFNSCGPAPSPASYGVGRSNTCPNGLVAATYVVSPNPATTSVSIAKASASTQSMATDSTVSMASISSFAVSDVSIATTETIKETPKVEIFDKYLQCRKTYLNLDISKSIDIRGLESGLYYLVITDLQHTERHQLVVQ